MNKHKKEAKDLLNEWKKNPSVNKLYSEKGKYKFFEGSL